jgi:drug/metabolite transporter (DMT)-like permease
VLLGEALREVRRVVRGETSTHRHFRDRLVVLAVTTVVVDLVCAVLAWLFERHAPRTELGDLGTALFWTTTQLISVSSSIQNPLTTPGRVLDVGMEVYAVTVVAALAGSFGSFFHRRSRERDVVDRSAAGEPAEVPARP